MGERVLVTGAMGCIGAWICKLLIEDGDVPIGFDVSRDDRRLRQIMSADDLSTVHMVQGDINDQAALLDAASIDGHVSRIIHTAALQLPATHADPAMGAAVNVVGTINVFETAKALGLDRVVYASSVAVYGPADAYESVVLPVDAPLMPTEHYGAHKQCNEATARVYSLRDGLNSIGLRPHTVYGPGRDQGLTSQPTMAMRAAALAESYTINYGGRASFVFVEDVARIFVQTAKISFQGAGVFGIKGQVAHMSEVVETIREVAGSSADEIRYKTEPLAPPAGMDDGDLARLLGEIPSRPLLDGVRRTVEHFIAIGEGGSSEE